MGRGLFVFYATKIPWMHVPELIRQFNNVTEILASHLYHPQGRLSSICFLSHAHKTAAAAPGLISVLQTGKRGNSYRARRLRTKDLLERFCLFIQSGPLSPVSSTYISLIRIVSYGHSQLKRKLGNPVLLAGHIVALNKVGILEVRKKRKVLIGQTTGSICHEPQPPTACLDHLSFLTEPLRYWAFTARLDFLPATIAGLFLQYRIEDTCLVQQQQHM